MKITVLHNQSLLDVALQHTGSLDGLFDIALANNLSITDDLTPGQELIIPQGIAKDKDILNYYRAKQIQPATAIILALSHDLDLAEGIGYWAISNDFKVS